MTRRTALLLSTLLGGFLPRALAAQEPSRRTARGGSGDATPRTRRTRASDATNPASDPAARAEGEPSRGDDLPPADFTAEPGRQWKDFDISPYTNLVPPASLTARRSAPQTAILNWIFRRTGSGPWHDDKVSVLSASRARLRVYHNPQRLKDVEEVVDQFVNATADFLSIRVRFAAAPDTRWRYPNYTRLTTLATGPQGQRVWAMGREESTTLLAQFQSFPTFRLLADRTYEVVNGQELEVAATVEVPYTGGLRRDGAVGLGFQPQTEKIVEGVDLKCSPLLDFDGDKVDLYLALTANVVRSLHRTWILAPRDVGTNETTIDVPEVAGTRLEQTVKGWPLDKTLVISGGILPGITLPNKHGLWNMRIPGTVPTQTELLVFLDARALERGRATKD